MIYCQKCVYPITAAHLEIADGVCSACKSSDAYGAINPQDWANRELLFEELVKSLKSNDGTKYDCLIPVSGGKDSFYQTHKMVEKYGLKPLLVTYNGNNYLPEGDFNRDLM